MKKQRLAIISDIHIGAGARAKDLCPENTEGRDKKPEDKFRDKFIRFVNEKQIKADYLILPGDITDRAIPEEVKIASEFVQEVAKALEVDSTNIVFVPGNHDVDWSVFKIPDTTGVRHAQRYDPIRAPLFCFKSIVDRGAGSLFESPHFTVWMDENLLVMAYNSAHHDNLNIAHHGFVHSDHIAEMGRVLATIPYEQKQLRVFLVHHHLFQYDDPTPECPDTSIMVNAEQLQQLLREHHFDLLVHGHRHLPRFTTHSVNGSSELVILCSGSFSVTIDTRWAGTISNQFHLITIDGRDGEEHLIKGIVESWSYNCARGWSESNPAYDGIPYVEPFGTYIRPEVLKKELTPLLKECFDVKDFVEWRVLRERKAAYRHLRPEVVRRVLDELGATLGFRRLRDAPDKIILLKGIS